MSVKITRSMSHFVDEIKDFKNQGEKDLVGEAKRRNAKAFQTMVNISPVWTGNYLSNFNILIGNQMNPLETVVPKTYLEGSNIPVRLDETAENALRTKMLIQTKILKAYNKLGKIRIINNCNYAKGVEYGDYPARMPYMVFASGWDRLIYK